MMLRPQSALNGTFGSATVISQSNNAVLTELSGMGCVLFTGRSGTPELARVAGAAAKVEFPITPGELRSTGGRAALWLSPCSWLVQCTIDHETSLVMNLNEAFQGKAARAVPFTDALCWFELSGAAALDYMTEGSFISLEPGGLAVGCCKRTLIAQIAAVVVRPSQNIWQIAVERSRASYFAGWITSAANAAPQND